MSDTSRDTETISWDLLDRYYAGETSLEEQARIQAYLVNHPIPGAVWDSLARTLQRSQEQARPDSARTLLAAAHTRLARRASLRRVLHDQTHDRLGYAIAALLDAQTDTLSAEDVKELRQMIDVAREDGR